MEDMVQIVHYSVALGVCMGDVKRKMEAVIV